MAISMARTGMATFWQWLAFHEGLLSPLLPIYQILLHFLRLFSCFYEDLTVFWPPSWWLRWTRPCIILASSCEFKILDPLANSCKFVFASYMLQVIVWAYIKCSVWKCYQSIIFHGIFINYTNTIRQRSKLYFFLLIALKVS